jgi:Raf kinase inhibitor-like YbhB/YbcL family protein
MSRRIPHLAVQLCTQDLVAPAPRLRTRIHRRCKARNTTWTYDRLVKIAPATTTAVRQQARVLTTLGVLAVTLLAVACGGSSKRNAAPAAGSALAPLVATAAAGSPVASPVAGFALTSAAFQDGGAIPTIYTCDGQNHSPALAWTAPPPSTRAFALIVDDPDAPGGSFTHWVLFDAPATLRVLPEGVGAGPLQDGTLQGKNGSGKDGYTGPCPPSGSTHHYRFTLYALAAPLGLSEGAALADVRRAMQGHVLTQAEVVGTYRRAGS